MLIAWREENDQYGLSICQPVGLAQGSLMRAWSCQMRIPSALRKSSMMTKPCSAIVGDLFGADFAVHRIPCGRV